MTMHVDVRFHPVGQGLFSTGKLHTEGGSFSWIYDCGTTSSQKLVTNALARLQASWGHGKHTVNLVVLSHFDHDHISGLLLVLKQFQVDTLLLPHVPLEQRLIQAYQSGIRHGSQVMRFIVNPVGYVRALGDNGPRRILIVPPARRRQDQAGRDDARDTPRAPDPDRNEPEPLVPTLEAEVEDRASVDAGLRRELILSDGIGGIAAEAIVRGSALRIGNDWEFFPYNDASLAPKAPAAFVREVRRRRDVLLAKPDKASLDALKKVYDDEFTDSALGRNIVSLFVYAGGLRQCRYVDCYVDRNRAGQYRRYTDARPRSGRAGFLYTGDGYLDTPLRLKQYLRHLGSRIDASNCLQVMHHGASSNWHPGVASALAPVVSVFSSNPGHRKFRHPHGEVVRDFLPYQPVQVDANTGMSVSLDFR